MATKTTKASKSKPAPAKSTLDRANAALLKQVLSASAGILRLAPTWVPRLF